MAHKVVMLMCKSYNKNMKKTKQKNILRPVLIVASALVFLGLVLSILEKTNVINLYKKHVDTNVNTPADLRPTNTVDYSPATPDNNTDINSQKASGSIDNPKTTTPPNSSPISVVLSAANQDEKGGPVIVRAILDNLTGGTCTLTLTKGSIVKTYHADVTWLGTYYGCGGFDVPYSDLSVGAWNLKLVVTQNANRGEASQTVTVEAS